MKTTVLRFGPKQLEDPRFYMEVEIQDKFFSDHNITEKEVGDKTIIEMLGSPYNMGTYVHSTTGPAYCLKALEAYTMEDGTKIAKDQIRHEEYWFEGKRKTGEEEKELKHSIQFGSKVQDLIND